MSKKKKTIQTGTPALVFLEKSGIPTTVYTYEHNPDHMSHGYGLEGASQLSIDPHRIFKTLLVDVSEDSHAHLVTAIVPVTSHLNLKAIANIFHSKKAHMADPTLAQKQTGYVVGGISPFGHKISHPTVLDSSTLAYDEILVSGGRRGLSIGIDPHSIETLLNAKIASIAAEGSHPQ